jgi:thiamine biosynthesis lipoprotein
LQQKAGTTNLTKNRIKPAVLLALAAVLVLAALAARVVFSDRKTEKVERDAYKLGTVVRISVYGQNRRLLDKAADDALERGVTRLENEFSVNIASSEISRINSASRGGRQITVGGVPYDTGYLVGRALEIARETGGAFDPTVYPIVKLWGIGTDHARVPVRRANRGRTLAHRFR